MKGEPARSVDEYLLQVPSAEAWAELVRLRAIILEEVPEGVESISYGIPMVKYNKTTLGYAAFKNHCSFFPGHTVRYFLDDLVGFKTSKGTIQFTPEKPIPDALLRTIIKARFFEER